MAFHCHSGLDPESRLKNSLRRPQSGHLIHSIALLVFLLSACGKSGNTTSEISAQNPQSHKTFDPTQSPPQHHRCRNKGRTTLSENQEVYIKYVKDGDTAVGCVLPEGDREITIRILGIDCPETAWNDKCIRDGRQGRKGCAEQIPLGREAKRRAIELLAKKTIRLESKHGTGRFQRERYGRTLAYLRLADGRDFGKELVREGLCEDFGWKFSHPRSEEYKRLQH